MYAKVEDLPALLRAVLREVGYTSKDVKIEPATEASLQVSGGDGQRGFAAICNLLTGERSVTWGSWGGANIFNPTNPVDLDRASYVLPPGAVVITGSRGSYCYAVIKAHPDALAKALPAPVECTDRERKILATVRGYKAGYRREALARARVTDDELDVLVARGLLARNKAGALSLTIAGKNAAEQTRPGL